MCLLFFHFDKTSVEGFWFQGKVWGAKQTCVLWMRIISLLLFYFLSWLVYGCYNFCKNVSLFRPFSKPLTVTDLRFGNVVCEMVAVTTRFTESFPMLFDCKGRRQQQKQCFSTSKSMYYIIGICWLGDKLYRPLYVSFVTVQCPFWLKWPNISRKKNQPTSSVSISISLFQLCCRIWTFGNIVMPTNSIVSMYFLFIFVFVFCFHFILFSLYVRACCLRILLFLLLRNQHHFGYTFTTKTSEKKLLFIQTHTTQKFIRWNENGWTCVFCDKLSLYLCVCVLCVAVFLWHIHSMLKHSTS